MRASDNALWKNYDRLSRFVESVERRVRGSRFYVRWPDRVCDGHGNEVDPEVINEGDIVFKVVYDWEDTEDPNA